MIRIIILTCAFQTKEAQQRLDEMRNMINRRQGSESNMARRIRAGGLFEDAPKSRDRSGSLDVLSARLIQDQQITRTANDVLNDADESLSKALKSHEELQEELNVILTQFKEVRGTA